MFVHRLVPMLIAISPDKSKRNAGTPEVDKGAVSAAS
jgi:hypothetical protein